MDNLQLLEQVASVLEHDSPLTHLVRVEDIVDSIYEIAEMYDELAVELNDAEEEIKRLTVDIERLEAERDDLAYDLDTANESNMDLYREIERLESLIDNYEQD